MTRITLIVVLGFVLGGCGGNSGSGGDTGPTAAEREREERRVYRACVTKMEDVLVDPEPDCREVARQCAYLLGVLEERGQVPSEVWNGANECRRW